MSKDKECYRILFIEDNEGDCGIVEDFLTEQIVCPVIVRAINFKQAVHVLSENDSQFDVILLDITLPDKSGQPLVTEMLRIAGSVPVIILTGYADIDFSIRSIAQGISDYLLKDDLNAGVLYKSILYAITRNRNNAALKESEKRYSDLFYLSPQPMWVFDPKSFHFIQVNNATISLYGYSNDEFLAMTLMDIKIEDEIPEAKKELSKPTPDKAIFKKTITHRKKNGELMEMEIYSTPIVINNRQLRSVIAIDVTEKNLYEHRILKAIIKTQEDERYEIGGELHDNVCQILAASQISLSMFRESLAPGKQLLFLQVSKYISMAIEEIRNLSHRLAPAFFDETNLSEAVGRLVEDFNVSGKYKIVMHFSDAVSQQVITKELQLNLYRILQEQLKNIVKYSIAAEVHLDVIIYKNKLVMRVADDGIGFDLKAVKKGIGFANMKRRAELFNGLCEINSSPGNGCEILVTIPLAA